MPIPGGYRVIVLLAAQKIFCRRLETIRSECLRNCSALRCLYRPVRSAQLDVRCDGPGSTGGKAKRVLSRCTPAVAT